MTARRRVSSGSGTAFASNGYNATVSSSGSASGRNEFAGQRAWSGNTSGWVATLVNLTDTAKFAGKNLRLRWRIATNSNTSSSGWYVDSIVLLGGGDITLHAPVITTAASSSATETVTDPDTSVHQIIYGTATNLSVTATDDAGEAALKYTWSVASGADAPVAFSANASHAAKDTSASFATAGDYQITVSVLDGQGLATTSSVNVRVVQTAVALSISPSSATVVSGATQAFAATLLDQFGLVKTSLPESFTWSVSGGGTINASGVFSPTTVGGPYSITASNSGISNTASITVSPAAAAVVVGNLNLTYNGSPQAVVVTTSPPSLAVAVTYNGSTIVPTAVGNYLVQVSVTDPAYQGFASATLVIAPGNDWISWRGQHFSEAEQTAGLSAETADPDSDNWPNLAEYALGSDPRQFTPPLIASRDANGLSVTFTRPANLPDVSYAAESSNDLSTWNPVPLELLTPGSIETLRVRDSLETGNPLLRFLRLHFERP